LTVEELIEHLRTSRVSEGGIKMPVPPIACRNGFFISVQASEHTYCTPRNDEGPWTHVECGYPSWGVPELAEYAEDPDDAPGTVYPYVPIDLVVKVINDNDGWVDDALRLRRKGII
jgi:hypothetical protein